MEISVRGRAVEDVSGQWSVVRKREEQKHINRGPEKKGMMVGWKN